MIRCLDVPGGTQSLNAVYKGASRRHAKVDKVDTQGVQRDSQGNPVGRLDSGTVSYLQTQRTNLVMEASRAEQGREPSHNVPDAEEEIPQIVIFETGIPPDDTGRTEPPNLALTCAICKWMYKDPVMLECGHTFCRVCVLRNGPRCGSCRKLHKDAYTTNFALADVLAMFPDDMAPPTPTTTDQAPPTVVQTQAPPTVVQTQAPPTVVQTQAPPTVVAPPTPSSTKHPMVAITTLPEVPCLVNENLAPNVTNATKEKKAVVLPNGRGGRGLLLAESSEKQPPKKRGR